jgi:hypothetical protein
MWKYSFFKLWVCRNVNMVIWYLCGYMQRRGVLCFAWTQVHINCNVSEIPNIGGMNKWCTKL